MSRFGCGPTRTHPSWKTELEYFESMNRCIYIFNLPPDVRGPSVGNISRSIDLSGMMAFRANLSLIPRGGPMKVTNGPLLQGGRLRVLCRPPGHALPAVSRGGVSDPDAGAFVKKTKGGT